MNKWYNYVVNVKSDKTWTVRIIQSPIDYEAETHHIVTNPNDLMYNSIKIWHGRMQAKSVLIVSTRLCSMIPELQETNETS